MIFYDCSTAPNPRRARMFIAEKGLNIDTRYISMRDGEQLSADFREINPRATIPVLITDEGTTLTENVAIALYLEERHPEPPLIGRTPDEKANVFNWNTVVEQHGLMPIGEAFRNSSPYMKGRAITGPVNIEQIPELAERGRLRVGWFFDMLEKRLSQSRFLASDQFSLADISAFVFVDFSRVIKMRIPEDNTATKAWFDAIKARPSAAL